MFEVFEDELDGLLSVEEVGVLVREQQRGVFGVDPHLREQVAQVAFVVARVADWSAGRTGFFLEDGVVPHASVPAGQVLPEDQLRVAQAVAVLDLDVHRPLAQPRAADRGGAVPGTVVAEVPDGRLLVAHVDADSEDVVEDHIILLRAAA